MGRAGLSLLRQGDIPTVTPPAGGILLPKALGHASDSCCMHPWKNQTDFPTCPQSLSQGFP